MKTFKTSKAELLFLDLPINAINVRMLHGIVKYHNYGSRSMVLPSNDYTLIRKLSDVSEEVARELVDECPMFAKCWKHYGFVETERHTARTPDTSCNTAIKSLNSIATHLGLNLENNIYLLKKL